MPPVYRWPGGNFVSGYDWQDGIGCRDRRPPRKNPAWKGIESNDFGLHEYFRNADMVFMANYAQTVNVIGAIKTTKTKAGFAATGQVLKLYRQQFGDKPVAITGDMRPLDVSAAWKGNKMTLAVVNPLEEPMSFPIRFEGGQSPAGGTLYLISGDDPMAYNVPGKEPAVGIQSSELESFSKNMTVPGLSISLYVLDME